MQRGQGGFRWRELVLGVVLGAVLLGPLTGGGRPDRSQARAQIPNSGLQRKRILQEARRTNELLEEILKVLRKGTLNVRIRGADNPGDAAGR